MSVKYVNRKGTDCSKWDGLLVNFSREDLLPMWVADMDFEEADCIRAALRSYVDNVPFGYYSVPDDYYDSFIDWEEKYHGYKVQREWLCFSPGIVSAFHWVTLMLTKPGDSVIVLTPVYYPMLNAVKNNDRKLVMCDLVRNGMEYSVDFERFENDIVENNVKVFIMSSPHNPIGKVWTAEELKKLMEICEKHGVFVISDEIHQDFEWEGHKHVPTATLGNYDKFLITMCSASKTFNLASTANSVIIIPDDELRARYKDFQQRISLKSGSGFGYVAVAAAFKEGRAWFEEVKEIIYENYLYVKKRFEEEAPEIGVGALEGTYLLWLNFGHYFDTQDKIADFCENKCKIAFDYGSWFGGERFAGFVRMNLATSKENVELAIDTILRELKGIM